MGGWWDVQKLCLGAETCIAPTGISYKAEERHKLLKIILFTTLRIVAHVWSDSVQATYNLHCVQYKLLDFIVGYCHCNILHFMLNLLFEDYLKMIHFIQTVV